MTWTGLARGDGVSRAVVSPGGRGYPNQVILPLPSPWWGPWLVLPRNVNGARNGEQTKDSNLPVYSLHNISDPITIPIFNSYWTLWEIGVMGNLEIEGRGFSKFPIKV